MNTHTKGRRAFMSRTERGDEAHAWDIWYAGRRSLMSIQIHAWMPFFFLFFFFLVEPINALIGLAARA